MYYLYIKNKTNKSFTAKLVAKRGHNGWAHKGADKINYQSHVISTPA